MSDTVVQSFRHMQSAHCESGVTASLVTHAGVQLSEPMAFGIGAGMFFAYLPLVRMHGLPLFTFRMFPGAIFNRVARQMRIPVRSARYRDKQRAADDLDRILNRGMPVGLQVGAFWLPFFPPRLRFHFNAHNLIAYGRKGDDYLISDPCFAHTVECPARSLLKARFSPGLLTPRGRLYYIDGPIPQPDWRKMARAGARRVELLMSRPVHPVPWFGVSGIRHVARLVPAWPKRHGMDTARQLLGQMIRMQEEIGTGGAGFRFLFAAFLQEAGGHMRDAAGWEKAAERFVSAGDAWREFASSGAAICRVEVPTEAMFADTGAILARVAELEMGAFIALRAALEQRD
jgi:hypothetical protein